MSRSTFLKYGKDRLTKTISYDLVLFRGRFPAKSSSGIFTVFEIPHAVRNFFVEKTYRRQSTSQILNGHRSWSRRKMEEMTEKGTGNYWKCLTRFRIIAKALNFLFLIRFQRQYSIVIARAYRQKTSRANRCFTYQLRNVTSITVYRRKHL